MSPGTVPLLVVDHLSLFNSAVLPSVLGTDSVDVPLCEVTRGIGWRRRQRVVGKEEGRRGKGWSYHECEVDVVANGHRKFMTH